MQVFVFIHQYSLCERMYHWSVAIDPVLNLIVIFLFSSEPGEGKKKGDQMSWWQHAALSKVALSIKIDRGRERGRYFSRTPTVWHFRKAVLSILSSSIVAHKEHRCLDWGNLSYGLRTQQRQCAGSDGALQSGESCSLYLSVVISHAVFLRRWAKHCAGIPLWHFKGVAVTPYQRLIWNTLWMGALVW